MKDKKRIIWVSACLLLFIFLPFASEPTRLTEQLSPPIVALSEEEVATGTQQQPTSKQVQEMIDETMDFFYQKGKIDGALDFFDQKEKIVAIGDSLTQGVGDETESGGYVGILARTLEENDVTITIENFGKRGHRTDQLLKRLDEEDIATAIQEADMIVMTIGANDIMKVVRSHYTNLQMEPFQDEQGRYEERLRAIFEKITGLNPEAPIYFIGFYNPFEPYFGEIEQLNLIFHDWTQASIRVSEEFDQVSFIPTEDLFAHSTENLLADDHFHPNTSGYELIAARVLEYLE